jgi:hypothetical protein
MSNITYLFGAGASANTIPVVKYMNKRFSTIKYFLSQKMKRNINEHSFKSLPKKLQDYNSLISEIMSDLEWLETECGRHQTVDTLARKYYLTDSNDLFRLKKVLIIYFTIEQLTFYKFSSSDKDTFIKKRELRFDSFFASILMKEDNKPTSIKKNIKILSWNYDLQIELALKNYIDKPISELKNEIKIYPNHDSMNFLQNIDFSNDSFVALKINGNAMFSNPTMIKNSIFKSVFDTFNLIQDADEMLGEILEEYHIVSKINNGEHLQKSLLYFNFSWELNKSFQNKYLNYDSHIELAEKIASETEYLVIIGYSFPVFNRELDRRIINKMSNLRKVYIQDPNCEAIKSTFNNGFIIKDSRYDYDFMLEKNVDQFLIPFEL